MIFAYRKKSRSSGLLPCSRALSRVSRMYRLTTGFGPVTKTQQLGQIHPGSEVSVLMHLVVWVHPKPRRLVHHTIHMKRVEVDTLIHEVPLAPEINAWKAAPSETLGSLLQRGAHWARVRQCWYTNSDSTAGSSLRESS